jgi:uncharacterized protein (TIGR02996 family)
VTHTDPTIAALYAGILAEPDCDTRRLVYADAIEESDSARAELIRVQVRLAGLRLMADALAMADISPRDPDWERVHGPLRTARAREAALLTSNRDRWLRVPCPKCDIGRPDAQDDYCVACNDTGDCGGLTWAMAWPNPWPQMDEMRPVRVDWDRGFPGRVEVPRLSDCVKERQGATGTRTFQDPSDWLAAVVRHHPITEVVPLDREPERWGDELFMWHNDDSGEPDDLPMAVFRLLSATTFKTRAAAISALGVAIVRWCRGHLAQGGAVPQK